MKLRAAGFFGVALLLGGCTDADWDKATSYASIEQPDAAAQNDTAAPVVVASMSFSAPMNPTISYCQKIARASGATATRDEMDNTQQQQTSDAIYRQCLRFYGASGQ